MIEIINDGDLVSVLIGGHDAEILDATNSRIVAECSLQEIENESTTDFPQGLALIVRSESGFDTYLFHELAITASDSGIHLDFTCHHPNKYWEGRFGLATFLDAIQQQVKFSDRLSVADIELEDDWKRLTLAVNEKAGDSVKEAINATTQLIAQVIKAAEISLSGMTWKKDYETNEALFCTDVLAPLLRRMGFLSVRYTHGNREYGKDFTFSELTLFGDLRHYGLQAKAGDVRGGVNADIEELIGQVNDAFSMPFYELGSKDARYISVFVIAISGSFTANAREKIAEKIPKGVTGSVYFLDRERIIELIDRYWLANDQPI